MTDPLLLALSFIFSHVFFQRSGIVVPGIAANFWFIRLPCPPLLSEESVLSFELHSLRRCFSSECPPNIPRNLYFSLLNYDRYYFLPKYYSRRRMVSGPYSKFSFSPSRE